ncbi:MAG: MerR family transcriptional regulator [Acidobacteria bacterium]|nr:MerR family transcriptional regulator [Acidobacteriota bacterium]
MPRIRRSKARFLSTQQVAELAGLARSTLERWVYEGKVTPRTLQVGRKRYRLWTEQGVAEVLLVKKNTYCKGRGRKRRRS